MASLLSFHLRCMVVLLAVSAGAAHAQRIPAPEDVLGFTPGADRRLAEWSTLIEYYRALAAASDRVRYRELGRTTLDAPFVALVITSATNMNRLEEIREINARLADPRQIASAAERERLLRDGRAIVLITSAIHSTEVGAHLSPAVLAHRLATGDDEDTRRILDETVVLLVPSLNPDGVTIVTRWYEKTLDTRAEGLAPPTLYHHYVGHDNNRDWYAFTQVETRLTIDSLHNRWHPQIVHDIHQQGQYGSRFFVPPFLDPVEPNVDPLIVHGFTTLGTYMAWRLNGQGKQGIVTDATYDAWTPARSYQHHHAGVRVLSETASARLATPLDVHPNALQPGRNFDPRMASANFPDPWPGGRWALAHIIDYQTSGALALLEHAASHRRWWLSGFSRMGQRAVDGWESWPYAVVIPRTGGNTVGRRAALAILQRGQVEIRAARAPFEADGVTYPTGTYVVILRQPYASFAKTLLERQIYPDLRLYPGGPPRAPYDVTAHTLPLLMGFDAVFVQEPFPADLTEPVFPPEPLFSYDGVSETAAARTPPRVGLYRSYTASMDEGWTRWIFDTWGIPYVSLVDSVVRSGRLPRSVRTIVIPDMTKQDIVGGLPPDYPPPFHGGLGPEGVQNLRVFVQTGGTLITFNHATAFAIDAFDLPARNVLEGVDSQGFYAPGSIFRLELDPHHPLSRNMPETTAAWFQQSPAFDVTQGTGARVVARYPTRPDDVLLSGWVLHPERVAGRAALVEVSVGQGRVILYGFRPQYRGQSIATYPLFFNALTAK